MVKKKDWTKFITYQRLLVEFFYTIKMNAVGRYFTPAIDKALIDDLGKSMKKSFDMQKDNIAQLTALGPDIAHWLDRGKYTLLPGGGLVFTDAINTMCGMASHEKVVEFFRQYITNDPTYVAAMLYFGTFTHRLMQHGLLDIYNRQIKEMTQEESDAFSTMFIRQLAAEMKPHLKNKNITEEQFLYGLSELFG